MHVALFELGLSFMGKYTNAHTQTYTLMLYLK